MATTQPKSGVTEYTTTTGTGPVTLTGPATGYRGFVSSDDGLVFHYAIRQAGTTFETGRGTYVHASRQFSRTTVKGNKDGTTSPLNLGSGTKEVSITLPGELTAMLDVVGEWEADQHFNGYRIYLDADQDTWIDVATDDLLRLYFASVETLQISGGSPATLLVRGTDDTASEGPLLVLRRDSASAVGGDGLGVIYSQGKDTGGTVQQAFKLYTSWLSPAAGSHSSLVTFSVASAGALQSILTLRPGIVSVPTGIALLTAGKTSSSQTIAGSELYSNGSAQIVCVDGSVPLILCRAAGDGTFMALYANGALISSVSNASGTVTWGPFTGNHYADYASGVSGDYERLGTVLAGTGTLLATVPDPFYEVRPAVSGDRRVLGVWGGRQRTNIMGGEERDLIVLFAVGNGWVRATGPIAAGDLLWASGMPGVAERQPNQDAIGPWTVAKATNDSPEDGAERLVSCIYMAG